MRFKKIEYKIARINGEALCTVDGFAVGQRFVPVRICVRHSLFDAWSVDHYDTGLSITRGHKYRMTAVIFGILKLMKAIKTGEYAKRLAMWERGGL